MRPSEADCPGTGSGRAAPAEPTELPDEFERGRQQGMKQEHALWELMRNSEEIEALKAPAEPTELRKALAAMGQASFCLRTLLPNDPDAQMTVAMLDAARAALKGAS